MPTTHAQRQKAVMKNFNLFGIRNWHPLVRSWAKRGAVIALLGPIWGYLILFLAGSSATLVNPIAQLGIAILALSLFGPDWFCDQLRVSPTLNPIVRALVYVVWNVAFGGGVGA